MSYATLAPIKHPYQEASIARNQDFSILRKKKNVLLVAYPNYLPKRTLNGASHVDGPDASRPPLGNRPVGHPENEISPLKPRVTSEYATGRLLTLDALHTHRDGCAQVQQGCEHYRPLAKNNQPTSRAAFAEVLQAPRPDRRYWQEAETWNKAPGRWEHRPLLGSPDLQEWFEQDWAASAQVFRLERPSRLLSLIRVPWTIENRLPHRRDVP